MVDLLQPPRETSPIVDILMVVLTATFAFIAVGYAVSNLLSALIPLACTVLFFCMYLAHKGVIGGH